MTQDETPGFASYQFPWTRCLEVRPRYPDSWYQRIYDYYQAKNGSWQLAHDVGAGPGLVAERLADTFEKVAVSEPNDEYFQVATKSLRNGKYPAEKYIMKASKAEESWLEDEAVDMACMNCVIHWTEPQRALEAMAKSLKPGGTIAVLTVSRPRIVEESPVAAIWESMWDTWYDPAQPLYQKEMGSPLVQRGLALLENWLDNIEFPEHLFRQVHRFHINGPSMACSATHPCGYLLKIGHNDVVAYLDEKEDWGNEVDVAWFRKLMTSYPKAHKMSEAEESKPMWRQLEEAMLAGQKVKIYWPVGLVLATRK